MLQLILAIGGPAAGLLGCLFLLWRLERSHRETDSERNGRIKAERVADDIRSALMAENRRLEAQVRVLRAQNQALRSHVSPADYLRGVLEAASTDPSHPAVPGGSTPGNPEGSSNR